MKKLLLIALPAVFLYSCGSEKSAEETTQTDTTAVKDETIAPTKTCYAWIKGNDTVWMSLEQKGNALNGELNYLWFEKDSNHGTIKGEMKGDTLIADYTFMAEGMESVRKEFFLKKGDGFVVGHIDYENDEEPYEAKDVTFDGELLKPVDCK